MEVVIYQHPSAPSRLSVCVCPFVHHEGTPLPMDRFPLNLILETFIKKSSENPY
jgi:hypothetical protein